MSTDECINYYKFWVTGREPRSKKVRSQPALKWYDDSNRVIICLSYDDLLENFDIKGIQQCIRDGSFQRFMERCAVPNISDRISSLSSDTFQTTQSIWNLVRIIFQVKYSDTNDKKDSELNGFRDWLDTSRSKNDFLKARESVCAHLTTIPDGIKFLFDNKEYIHNQSMPNSDMDWKRLLDYYISTDNSLLSADRSLSFFYGKLLLTQETTSETEDMLLVDPQREKTYDKMPCLPYLFDLERGYLLVEEAANNGILEACYLLKDIEMSNPNQAFWRMISKMELLDIAKGILEDRILPAINEGLKCTKDKKNYIELLLEFIVELKCIIFIWQDFKNSRNTQLVFSEYIQKCKNTTTKIGGLNNYTFNYAEIVRELMTRYKNHIFPNMPFYHERKFVFGLVQQMNQRPNFFDFSGLAEHYQLARWMCETNKEARLFQQSRLEDKIDLIVKNLQMQCVNIEI